MELPGNNLDDRPNSNYDNNDNISCDDNVEKNKDTNEIQDRPVTQPPASPSDYQDHPLPPHEELFAYCFKSHIEQIQQVLQSEDKSWINSTDEEGLAPLHLAIKGNGINMIAMVDLLLSNEADVNKQTIREENTALHLTVYLIEPESKVRALVLTLLSYGADPFLRNRRLRSCYDYCIDKGYVNVAKELDESLATLQDDSQDSFISKNSVQKKPGTMRLPNTDKKLGLKLIRAIIDNNTEEIEHCLNYGADPNVVNEHGAAAIHYTINRYHGDKIAVMEMILNSGGDVNLLDHENDNALNLAIKMSELRQNSVMQKLVAFLVANGATATHKDLDGKDARILAKDYQDITDILKGILLPDSRTPKNVEVPKQEEPEQPPTPVELIEEPDNEVDRPVDSPEPPVDLNKPDENGLCLIHHAVEKNSTLDEIVDEVESLVNNGADVNKPTTKEGNTAVHLAAAKPYLKVVKKLIELNADCNIKNKEGKQAILLVPASSSQFQPVPASSSQFQPVTACSSQFQPVTACSKENKRQ